MLLITVIVFVAENIIMVAACQVSELHTCKLYFMLAPIQRGKDQTLATEHHTRDTTVGENGGPYKTITTI